MVDIDKTQIEINSQPDMLDRQPKTKAAALLPIERKSVTTSLSILEKRIEEDDIPDDDVTSFEFQSASFV